MSPEESSICEEEFLPVVSVPYLPSVLTQNKKFTLVLDLDETLIHYVEMAPHEGQESEGGRFLVRPGVH